MVRARRSGRRSRWGTPIHVKMAIMRHESAFRHDAKPPRYYFLGFIPWGYISSAEGYPQALDGTWKRYLNEVGRRGASRGDFDDSLDFIGWYLTKSKDQIGLSFGDTYSQYPRLSRGPDRFQKRHLEGQAEHSALRPEAWRRPRTGMRAS